jgi:predicted N-acetyltransferase YhbS
MGNVKIAPLAEHPHHIDELALLLHTEWGELSNWSDPAMLKELLGGRLRTGTAPLTFVALDEDRLVGSVSIKKHELPSHPDKEYWIGDVIVAADCRGHGIGTLMMRAIVTHASQIGIRMLHLYTPDQEHYYRKLGWQTIGYDQANGERVVIMCYLGISE